VTSAVSKKRQSARRELTISVRSCPGASR
jgi:hypothetical protein